MKAVLLYLAFLYQITMTISLIVKHKSYFQSFQNEMIMMIMISIYTSIISLLHSIIDDIISQPSIFRDFTNRYVKSFKTSRLNHFVAYKIKVWNFRVFLDNKNMFIFNGVNYYFIDMIFGRNTGVVGKIRFIYWYLRDLCYKSFLYSS